MKVIDLLNKIANGEEDRLKYHIFSRNDYCTIDEFFARYIIDEENLNLEIIEDTTKENKRIEDRARFQYSEIPSWFDIHGLISIVNNNFEKHQKALNEVIERLNEVIDNEEDSTND